MANNNNNKNKKKKKRNKKEMNGKIYRHIVHIRIRKANQTRPGNRSAYYCSVILLPVFLSSALFLRFCIVFCCGFVVVGVVAANRILEFNLCCFCCCFCCYYANVCYLHMLGNKLVRLIKLDLFLVYICVFVSNGLGSARRHCRHRISNHRFWILFCFKCKILV